MASKYNEEFIKSFLKELDCILLSSYKNTSVNFSYRCSCGEVSESNFNRFKNGQKGCWKCKGNRSNMNNKLTIQFVSEYFRSVGCELLETEYINSNSKMKYVCICGNEDYKNWYNFKKGQRCKRCAAEKKRKKSQLNLEDVKLMYRQHGCELTEDKYINNKEKMKFHCHCGREELLTLKEFRKYKQCKVCSNILQYDKEKIINIFKQHDCEVLIDDYLSNQQVLDYICSCGTLEKTIIHNYIHSTHKKCKTCTYKLIGEKQALRYEDVKIYFESKGCTLLSKEYSNNSEPLDYICSCGNISRITFNSFSSGRRCLKCAVRNGENHPRWNPELTDEEREKKRHYPEYRTWRTSVYERDKYTCQCCGDSKGGNLIAHHLDGWDWNKVDRFNVDNGLTLCEICHNDFHNLYGYGGNTKEQFEEYLREIYESVIN